MATKADLAELRRELRAEMGEMRNEMDVRFARLETDLLWVKRIGAVIVALLAVPILQDLLSVLF